MQRITLSLLVMLSIGMIALGRTDQLALESLRSTVMDAAAPALEILSRPAELLDAAVNRANDFMATYRSNAQLEEENEKLLRWQQAALRLASENAQLRDLLK